jgi:DNA polymerase-4
MQPTVRWLFLDLNSFFASCEQQENPELRGRPVGIIPLQADTTAILAASYPAKKFGIKTGTSVGDAKKLCPDIALVLARPKLYVQYHHRILTAIDHCIPVEHIMSIDEVACRLTSDQQLLPNAKALAQKIKDTIRSEVGDCMTSSVGLSLNPMLAKVAADMQKPDGLTVLTGDRYHEQLFTLRLQDFPGIGPRMEKRIRLHGIGTVEELWNLDSLRMRMIWGGVGGAKFHALLHGNDLASAESRTSSMSHQHVLEPHLRSRQGGLACLRQLLEKGTERLRRNRYYCCGISVHAKLTRQGGYFEASKRFSETQDTAFLLQQLQELWQRFPKMAAPLRVAVVLHGLIPANSHQMSLFENPKKSRMMQAIDSINAKYGRGTVSLGLDEDTKQLVGKDKIAFQRVPDIYEV